MDKITNMAVLISLVSFKSKIFNKIKLLFYLIASEMLIFNPSL